MSKNKDTEELEVLDNCETDACNTSDAEFEKLSRLVVKLLERYPRDVPIEFEGSVLETVEFGGEIVWSCLDSEESTKSINSNRSKFLNSLSNHEIGVRIEEHAQTFGCQKYCPLHGSELCPYKDFVVDPNNLSNCPDCYPAIENWLQEEENEE